MRFVIPMLLLAHPALAGADAAPPCGLHAYRAVVVRVIDGDVELTTQTGPPQVLGIGEAGFAQQASAPALRLTVAPRLVLTSTASRRRSGGRKAPGGPPPRCARPSRAGRSTSAPTR